MSLPFVTFNAKQSHKVLDLLGEYSKRLQDLLDQLERLKEERITIVIQVMLVVLTIIIAYVAPRFLSEAVVFPVIVAIGSIWFHSTVTTFRFYLTGRFKLKRIEDELRMLTPKVERLFSVASQLEEHTRQDAGARLEFDFELSYTEEVLRRADLLMRKSNKG